MRYAAFLKDKDTGQELLIGQFEAGSPGDAIDIAAKAIKGTMKRLVCNKWYVIAKEVSSKPVL